MPRRAEEEEKDGEGSGRIKRKVCKARDVSAAEAACLPPLLLALRPASETRVKDRDIASLCTRTPFPSFIYLCLSGRRQRVRLSTALFSGCFPPHYSSRTVYVGTETDLRFEVPVLTCCHHCPRVQDIPLSYTGFSCVSRLYARDSKFSAQIHSRRV